MNSKTAKRLIALFTCILFIAAFLFTTSFIVEHAGHDCMGRDCSVCAQINSAEKVLKQLSAAMVGAGFIVGCLFFIAFQIRPAVSLMGLSTLVYLKVKMDN